MIIRPVKSGKFWKILYESKEEAQAVADYLNQILLSGNPDQMATNEKVYWQGAQEVHTGDA